MSETAPSPRKYVVGRCADVPEGGRIIVEAGGREVGIFRVDGEFHAFLNRCPHLGAPLCEGEILGLIESNGPGDIRFDSKRRMLVCPWHGWEFDIRNGQSYWDPARTRARRYPIGVESGSDVAKATRTKGPYVADIVPVSIEGDYLVVTMRPGGGAGHPSNRLNKHVRTEVEE